MTTPPSEPQLLISKSAGYIPSEQTAAALEQLARALTAEVAESEVDGFARTKPSVGTEFDAVSFRTKFVGPEPQSFCLGVYDQKDDGSGDLCIGLYW